MKLFVIGGAGYVGSHFAKYASKLGHSCTVYDNLSRGHRAAVAAASLIEGDILDLNGLTKALLAVKPDAILHYAAYALVGESVAQPAMYYENNVQGVVNILRAMTGADCRVPLVFSSSCAVFGTPSQLPMREDDPKAPQSPYGRSKLMAEEIIADVARAESIPALALRYFNACGADESGDLGEDHLPETHLIPNAMKAAINGTKMRIFGNDFETADGTCVRDYIHVVDLADAHLRACELMCQSHWAPGLQAVHLGTGQGYSNLQVLQKIEEIVGLPVPYEFSDRRPGDPAALFADNNKAKRLLGFEPTRSSLEHIITTAWRWHKHHPEGFPSE